MNKRKIEVYSAEGLSKKIGKLKLSKREAAKLRLSIECLSEVPIKNMVSMGKIRKIVGSDNVYVYKVDQKTRMMISEIADNEQPGVVIHDVVTLPTIGKNRLMTRKKKQRKGKA